MKHTADEVLEWPNDLNINKIIKEKKQVKIPH